MDDGLCYFVIDHLSFWIDSHNTVKRQSVFPCIQRADSIGKCMWQHRDHPVNKIHTRSALICLPIKCTSLLHIVCHIRNMHTELIIFSFFCNGDRIVQIFRIFSIDRYHSPGTDIHTPCHICTCDVFCHPLCLI